MKLKHFKFVWMHIVINLTFVMLSFRWAFEWNWSEIFGDIKF